jgi:8-amino-7-oxononanoate synthase
MAALERRLQGAGGDGRPAVVVSDSVFSMEGDRAPLLELAELSSRYGAWLMIDDAHGFGVFGPQGRGAVAEQGLNSAEVPVLMATLGKAVGTFGAFVAGDRALIETLVQQARSYVYTTAVPPAVAAATRTALRLVADGDELRERLQASIARFRRGAAQLGLLGEEASGEGSTGGEDSPIQPLLLGSSELALRAAEALLDLGLVVTAIRPPTVPEGSARLRVTLSAAHTGEQVDSLVDGLDNVLRSRDD